MTRTPTRARLVAVFAILLAAATTVAGQTRPTYKARLFPLPVDANTQATTTGTGAVTATLRGTTLSISGSFSGLQKPATDARLHVAARGMRGPAVHDLVVTNATAGTVRAELPLTPAQIDHLARGRLYVQIHSDAAPEGNLWGWLLP